MFKFLKKKLKDAVSSLSKKVEEEGKQEEVVEEVKKEEVKVEKSEAAVEPQTKAPAPEATEDEESEEEVEDSGKDDLELTEEVKKEVEEKESEAAVEPQDKVPAPEATEEEVDEDIEPLSEEDLAKVDELIEKDQKGELEVEDLVSEEAKEEAEKILEEVSEEIKKEESEKKDEVVIEEPKEVEIEEVTKVEEKVIEKEVPEVEAKEVEVPEPEPVERKDQTELATDATIEALEEKEKLLEKKDQALEKEAEAAPKVEKKGFFKKLFGKKEEPVIEQQSRDPAPPPPKAAVEKKEATVEKKAAAKKEEVEESGGFFSKISKKITTTTINQKQFDELFWDMELALLENNVAVQVIEKIKADLASELVDQPLKRGSVEASILGALKDSISSLFTANPINLIETIKNNDGPYAICFVGINGAGKTTSIAKVAQLLKDNNLSCVIAACDTFRAAAIDQLGEHANNLGVKMIKQDYGADPAAVAFDAIAHAKKEGIDAVLIDTAGRLHSNTNLMDELHKIIRVAKPQMKIFVGEAVTGNDCVEQALKFNETVDLTGIILSKADVDEKGGASISVSYVTGKPILYLGTGQEYKDLEPFDSAKLMESLGI